MSMLFNMATFLKDFAKRGGNGPYKVLLMGTDNVTLPTLKLLHASAMGTGMHAGLIRSVDVLCPGDRPAGRGQHTVSVPVKSYAVQHSLRTVEVAYGVKDLRTWDASQLFRRTIHSSGSEAQAEVEPYDVGVVVSFGYFLPASILDPLLLGAINMHPSLLPMYRGSAPIPRAILAGDTVTGVSVIDVHREKFDAGAILAQEKLSIGAEEGCAGLTSRLATLGSELVMEVLADLPGRRTRAWQQVQQDGGSGSQALVSKAPKLRAEDGAVRWDLPALCTTEAIVRQGRAMDNSYGQHTYVQTQGPGGLWDGLLKRIKLLEVSAADPPVGGYTEAAESCKPGAIWRDAHAKRLLVRTSDGWVQLHRLLPEARKACTGADYANGLKLKGGCATHRFVHVPLKA